MSTVTLNNISPTANESIGAVHVRYGVISVWNPDGSLNREYRITGAQYCTLQHGGLPFGVNPGERWTGVGRSLDIGHGEYKANGDLTIMIGEYTANGHIIPLIITINHADIIGTFPNVSVSNTVVSSFNSNNTTINIQSIANGVITWALL